MKKTKTQNNFIEPELTGQEGWTELKIPKAYGKGRSFITGDKNKKRWLVKYFKRDSDNLFFAKVWFGPDAEGPPGYVHGGSMAAVLDEAMGISAWLTGHTVVAAKIIVGYRNMLPLGTVVTVEAWVDSVNGKKVNTKGKIVGDNDNVFTESEGLFINIDPKRFGDLIKHKDD